jgi:inosose dehydratase
MNIRIGTAPDSWGIWFPSDPQQVPWQRFLDEVAEAGYPWVELGPPGYLPTNLPTLRAELDRRGLKVSSAVVHGHFEEPSAWLELQAQLMAVGERLASLEAKYLVLITEGYTDHTGKVTRPTRLDDSTHRQFIETIHKASKLAQSRFGLRALVHNHGESYVEHEDQLEAVLAQTDPGLVSFCLDTGWLAYLGGDPVNFMRRHYTRIPYLHLKSVDRDIMKRVEAERLPTVTAVGMGVFCEPSQGVVDFPALRDVLREINFDGWAIVEQDMYPAPFDKPLPIAKRTRTYLREIGLG